MTSFIIYDSDNKRRELCSKIIKKFLYTSLDYYTVYEIDKYTSRVREELNHIVGNKVFIVNIDCEYGELFSRKIRTNGDFVSPLILLTVNDRKEVMSKLRNILYLDVIEIGDNFILELMQSLVESYKITTRHYVYTFTSFDEVYRLPYDDIYYIEKNSKNDSVTIYTREDSFLDYITIKSICEKLKHDPRFMKIHRSYIVNIYNISSFDKTTNTITFKNGVCIKHVSRSNKPKLVARLEDCSYLVDENVL